MKNPRRSSELNRERSYSFLSSYADETEGVMMTRIPCGTALLIPHVAQSHPIHRSRPPTPCFERSGYESPSQTPSVLVLSFTSNVSEKGARDDTWDVIALPAGENVPWSFFLSFIHSHLPRYTARSSSPGFSNFSIHPS